MDRRDGMDSGLRRLQLCELEILDEFVRVCKKHGLQYYLVGGTLLGAARHRGFIPWDDDIDVAMPRADYDKFAQIAAEELSSQYFYQSPETDGHYFLSYAKIRKNGTEVYEERFREARFHKGVFIDIFPLDLCPAPGPVCHLLFNVLAVMNYRGQVDSGEAYRPYEELSGKLGYAVLRLFSPRRLVRARRRLLRLSERLSGGKYLACYAGAYGYYKEVFSSDWYQRGGPMLFEEREYTVPAMFRLILEQMFGPAYNTLPPVEEQTSHIRLDGLQL